MEFCIGNPRELEVYRDKLDDRIERIVAHYYSRSVTGLRIEVKSYPLVMIGSYNDYGFSGESQSVRIWETCRLEGAVSKYPDILVQLHQFFRKMDSTSDRITGYCIGMTNVPYIVEKLEKFAEIYSIDVKRPVNLFWQDPSNYDQKHPGKWQ